MLLEIIFFLFLGILVGTITGLTPGIHINLVGGVLIALTSTVFYIINPIYFVVFIVALAITHTFVDFIPSIFLGCPNEDTILSVLPGHKMLNQGRGYEAVLLACKGGIQGIFILILISFPVIFIVSKIYSYIEFLIAYILIFVSLFLIFSEERKFSALVVFLLCGFLGFIVLNFSENSSQMLLPLLTGLFGAAGILISMKQQTKIPKQKISEEKIDLKKPMICASIASPACGFLPGVGSGQAAIIGSSISKIDNKGFLVLMGATNTMVMGFSFISLYTIEKTRTGAAAFIRELIGIPSWQMLVLILVIALISGIISFFITKNIAKYLSVGIEKIDYKTLSILILLILILVVLLISKFTGLLILIVSTFTGIYCISSGVRRTTMMGCLLIPTIIYYLGL